MLRLGTLSFCGVTNSNAKIDLTGHPFDFASTFVTNSLHGDGTTNRITFMEPETSWTVVGTVTAKTITVTSSGSRTCTQQRHRNPIGVMASNLEARTTGSFPTTCKQVAQENQSTPDGVHTLSIIGTPSFQYQVYCDNMSGELKEYLKVNPLYNYGHWRQLVLRRVLYAHGLNHSRAILLCSRPTLCHQRAEQQQSLLERFRDH